MPSTSAQRRASLDRELALLRVDAAEGDEPLRVALHEVGVVVVGRRRAAGRRLGVDVQQHAEEIELLVEVGHLVGGLRRGAGAEVALRLLGRREGVRRRRRAGGRGRRLL